MPVRKGAASSAAPLAAVPDAPSLSENEAIIERSLASFVEVGLALVRIRDGQQYQATHPTFEAYLVDRWQMSRPRGYQLIEAAQATERVSTNGRHGPVSERVARELKPLAKEPEKMAEAWQEAVEEHGPRPTAEQVREKVQQRVRTRDRHQSRAARARKTNVQEDPLVISWVIRQRKAGLTRDQVIAASKAGADGWPRPGAALSKGTLSPIWRKTRVPKTTPPGVKQARQRDAKTRMEELAEALAIRNKATQALTEVNRQGSTFQALLYNLDLAELNSLDDKTLKPFINTAFVNLVDLMEIASMRIGEFQARASEDAVRAKIAIMRNPAGRTEAEMVNANAFADRLEKGLGDGLKLASG